MQDARLLGIAVGVTGQHGKSGPTVLRNVMGRESESAKYGPMTQTNAINLNPVPRVIWHTVILPVMKSALMAVHTRLSGINVDVCLVDMADVVKAVS